MADGELEIKVSVEAVAHNAFKSAAEILYKDYGLLVHRVSISWMDLSTPREIAVMADKIEVDSETRCRINVVKFTPKA